ncbi:hypothetical protein EYF80_044396 [Liparis tanakae]|uniref:Uncharacterized protein n=1 Tax=Liparis tanakae TaxID=230148 RepID=A0A4Z2FW18_9TELE|nr:hypothetical protein EYF80_044396 [Liparis tanakae]
MEHISALRATGMQEDENVGVVMEGKSEEGGERETEGGRERSHTSRRGSEYGRGEGVQEERD